MKNYQFRAIYFKNKDDGEVQYRSAPLCDAEGRYETIGLYELSEEKDDIEQNHIADIPREDFQKILNSQFPIDFKSWQKSHYEIVKILNQKKSDQGEFFILKQLSEYVRKDNCYALALYLTNQFEASRKEKPKQEKKLTEEIAEFLKLYKFSTEEILMHIF
jgi:hypothetical protein